MIVCYYLGSKGGLAGPTGVTATDNPKGDPLAVDEQSMLTKPHELTLNAAFLADDGIGSVHLEVYFVVGGFAAQYLVFRQVLDVVGHFGHAGLML